MMRLLIDLMHIVHYSMIEIGESYLFPWTPGDPEVQRYKVRSSLVRLAAGA